LNNCNTQNNNIKREKEKAHQESLIKIEKLHNDHQIKEQQYQQYKQQCKIQHDVILLNKALTDILQQFDPSINIKVSELITYTKDELQQELKEEKRRLQIHSDRLNQLLGYSSEPIIPSEQDSNLYPAINWDKDFLREKISVIKLRIHEIKYTILLQENKVVNLDELIQNNLLEVCGNKK
jgi:hypothetical protein